MDRFKETIAAAIQAGLDDSEGLLRLRYALAVARHKKECALRRVREARESTQASAPESSGIHTRCWHPLDRIARLPKNLPAYRIAEEVPGERHDG